MLQGKSLEPSGRKFAFSELGEVTNLHQLVRARFNDFLPKRIHESLGFQSYSLLQFLTCIIHNSRRLRGESLRSWAMGLCLEAVFQLQIRSERQGSDERAGRVRRSHRTCTFLCPLPSRLTPQATRCAKVSSCMSRACQVTIANASIRCQTEGGCEFWRIRHRKQ